MYAIIQTNILFCLPRSGLVWVGPLLPSPFPFRLCSSLQPIAAPVARSCLCASIVGVAALGCNKAASEVQQQQQQQQGKNWKTCSSMGQGQWAGERRERGLPQTRLSMHFLCCALHLLGFWHFFSFSASFFSGLQTLTCPAANHVD